MDKGSYHPAASGECQKKTKEQQRYMAPFNFIKWDTVTHLEEGLWQEKIISFILKLYDCCFLHFQNANYNGSFMKREQFYTKQQYANSIKRIDKYQDGTLELSKKATTVKAPY